MRKILTTWLDFHATSKIFFIHLGWQFSALFIFISVGILPSKYCCIFYKGNIVSGVKEAFFAKMLLKIEEFTNEFWGLFCVINSISWHNFKTAFFIAMNNFSSTLYFFYFTKLLFVCFIRIFSFILFPDDTQFIS